MKYTKDDLSKMSIAEINEALHKILVRWVDGDGHVTWMLGDDIITQTEGGYAGKVNYCNDWNDIMPLAVEHGIGMGKSPVRKEWVARSCNHDHSQFMFRCCFDASPQRAIACCLILVLQEQQQ
jgi:hypothetical protein